jgi:Domain of unknown function (DUF397)
MTVPTARDTGWYKSSRSNAGGDQCVEVRMEAGVRIGVRDSKSPGAGAFWAGSTAWSAFLDRATTGGFTG